MRFSDSRVPQHLLTDYFQTLKKEINFSFIKNQCCVGLSVTCNQICIQLSHNHKQSDFSFCFIHFSFCFFFLKNFVHLIARTI